LITNQEIQDIKRAIKVFHDTDEIAAITPDRSEKYEKGYINKLKEAGVKCDVWRIFVKKLKETNV